METLSNELERTIVELWREIFALQNVGQDDNFFALGGNSLMAMELTDRISERLDVHLSTVELFQNPTPGQLARYIEEFEAECD